MKYFLEEETYKIRGCLLNVHNELGCGFLEKVYQEALEIELMKAEIPFSKEKDLTIYYKGVQMQQKYVADFVLITSW